MSFIYLDLWFWRENTFGFVTNFFFIYLTNWWQIQGFDEYSYLISIDDLMIFLDSFRIIWIGMRMRMGRFALRDFSWLCRSHLLFLSYLIVIQIWNDRACPRLKNTGKICNGLTTYLIMFLLLLKFPFFTFTISWYKIGLFVSFTHSFITWVRVGRAYVVFKLSTHQTVFEQFNLFDLILS